jgi:hypothetical protein
VQRDHSTGGWISTLDWATTLLLGKKLAVSFNQHREHILKHSIQTLILSMFLLQVGGSIAILTQRWIGNVGTTAHIISDTHGCIPHDGFK